MKLAQDPAKQKDHKRTISSSQESPPTALLCRALLSEVGEWGTQGSHLSTNCCLEPTTGGRNEMLLSCSEALWQRKETLGT